MIINVLKIDFEIVMAQKKRLVFRLTYVFNDL